MKVAVYGGDITGLVVARVMREAGHYVRIIERDVPGFSALIPRFNYLERSVEVTSLLDRLGVACDAYSIECGIMLHGKTVPCRKNLTQSVQQAYWRKTRLVLPPPGEVKAITDPESGQKRHAVTTSWHDMRKKLLDGVVILPEAKEVFDVTIDTRPLWEFSDVDAMSVRISMVPVNVVKDRFLLWDLVYTPFTPADYIHRLYHYGDGYVCEFSGAHDEDRLTSDLNFLFPHGWYLSGEISTTHGHLLPLASEPSWSGIYPIGRLAQWDDRVTMTNVIQQATSIAER